MHKHPLTKNGIQGNSERLKPNTAFSCLNGDFFIRISDNCESDRTGASCACPDRQGSQNTLSARTGCVVLGVENSGCSFVFWKTERSQLKTNTEALNV